MTWSVFNILIVISLLLTVIGIIRPQWPLISIALLIVCVALLVGQR